MSMLDKIKGMLKGHEDQAKQGVEKGGDFVDRKTQNKYSGQVDMAQEKLNQQLGGTRPPTDEAGK
ncbi:antitoxin [Streptomyces sp. H39-S7]|uniref:antitoxin n=1 Tax=Streptomyces sp. H39-S7 TaxID=3004357 RepID=UPI0022B0002D|nr:antitoxin [Streptomyces sp. H39-S7]MCZ4125650.1 antitoxin [Streptomyces sp. H39-S7]